LGAQYQQAVFRDESGKVNTEYNKHRHKVQLAFLKKFYWPLRCILWLN